MSVTLQFIEIPPKVSLKGNSTLFAMNYWGTGTPREVRVHCELTMYPAGYESKSVQMSALPDSDKIAVLNVSPLFEGSKLPEFAFPDHHTNLYFTRPGICVRYKLEAWVSYIDENDALVEQESLIEQDNLYYVDGGISLDYEAALRDSNSDWWTSYKDNKRWLNWLPGVKHVSPNAMEKLFFIAEYTGTTTFTINAKLVDGENVSKLFSLPVTEFVAVEMCVSPAIVQKLFDNTPVLSYTVVLGDGRMQAYRINSLAPFNEEFFLVANEFNVMESITCYGPSVESKRFGKVLHDVQLPDKPGIFSEGQRHIREEITHTNRISTGYLVSEYWAEWAANILAGGTKFKYGADWIKPVVVTTETAEYRRSPNFSPFAIHAEWDYSKRSRYSSIFNATFKIPMPFLIPPYYNELEAFFYKIEYGKVLDKLGGPHILIGNDGWELPYDAHPVFELENTEYWDVSIQSSTYYSPQSIVTPDFFTPENLLKYATIKTHNLLYFRGFANGDSRKILPMPLYLIERTQEQTKIITAWLDWVMGLLTASGNIVVSLEGNYPVVKSKSN